MSSIHLYILALSIYIIPQVLLPDYTKPLVFGAEERGKWTTHEVHNVRTHFRYYLQKQKLPSREVCQSFLAKYEVRRGRTVRDVYDKVKGMILQNK